MTNVDGDGIDVYVYNDYGDATVTIGGNQVDQSGDYGVYVYADGATELSSDVGGSILDNTVTYSASVDVYLDGSYSGSIRVNGVDVP